MYIYSPDGTVLLDVPITSAAKHTAEMMKDDYVALSWSQTEKTEIPVGAYIVYNSLQYLLLEPYAPTEKTERHFAYTPEFHHPKMYLSKVPFALHTTDSEGNAIDEYEWEIVDMPKNILYYICRAINKVFGIDDDSEEAWAYQVRSSFETTTETVTFQNVDIITALGQVASAFEAEWTIDWELHTIYFGKCLTLTPESPLTLKVGEQIGVPSVSTSKDGYFNRFLVYGGTRNISQKNAAGDNIALFTRLTLNPDDYPNGYIEKPSKGANEPAMTGILVFDDIYPSLNLYVYNARERQRYLLDEDGNKVLDTDGNPKMYSIWYIRLAYPTYAEDGETITAWNDFDCTDLILSGYELKASFEPNEKGVHSALAGREFAMTFHTGNSVIAPNTSTGDTGIEIKKGDYEINFYEEGESNIIIPTTSAQGLVPWGAGTTLDELLAQGDDTLCNDIVILFNIAMSETEYFADAQAKLAKAALEEIELKYSDQNNYTFKVNPVWLEANPQEFFVGQTIEYNDGNGYTLLTRITKIVSNLDFDIIKEITVGNVRLQGNTQTLKEDVKSAKCEHSDAHHVEQFDLHESAGVLSRFAQDGRTIRKDAA